MSFFLVTVLALGACSHSSTLAMSRHNISVGTASFDQKNVGIDLSQQVDVIDAKMGGASFKFNNAKNTVETFFTTSLKQKAKSIKVGKSDITLVPKLNVDVVNDYFTRGCLAKIEVTMLNAKGEQVKAVHKDFKKTYVMDWGYKDACNEAVTEVMSLALSAL